MATIIFHQPDGHSDAVDVEPGTSLMRAAVNHGVAGIVGECGGQAMCATCHVYIHDRHINQLSPVSDDEDEMLDCTSSPRHHLRSRLGCQISPTTESDEIHVDVPESQI